MSNLAVGFPLACVRPFISLKSLFGVSHHGTSEAGRIGFPPTPASAAPVYPGIPNADELPRAVRALRAFDSVKHLGEWVRLVT